MTINLEDARPITPEDNFDDEERRPLDETTTKTEFIHEEFGVDIMKKDPYYRELFFDILENLDVVVNEEGFITYAEFKKRVVFEDDELFYTDELGRELHVILEGFNIGEKEELYRLRSLEKDEGKYQKEKQTRLESALVRLESLELERQKKEKGVFQKYFGPSGLILDVPLRYIGILFRMGQNNIHLLVKYVERELQFSSVVAEKGYDVGKWGAEKTWEGTKRGATWGAVKTWEGTKRGATWGAEKTWEGVKWGAVKTWEGTKRGVTWGAEETWEGVKWGAGEAVFNIQEWYDYVTRPYFGPENRPYFGPENRPIKQKGGGLRRGGQETGGYADRFAKGVEKQVTDEYQKVRESVEETTRETVKYATEKGKEVLQQVVDPLELLFQWIGGVLQGLQERVKKMAQYIIVILVLLVLYQLLKNI